MIEVLRSGQLSLGPRRAGVRAAVRRARGRAATRAPCRSGTAGLHLALRAVGVEDGDEVDHEPVLVRGLGQRRALRAGAAGVRGHRPGHAQPRSRRPPRRPSPSARGRCCRCTSSATRPTCPRSRRSPRGTAWRSSRTPARRSARVHADGTPVGGRGHPGGVRLLRQQAAHHRRGRDGHARRRGAEGADRLRAQPGPRARHGLARPRPARLQLPPLGHRLRARDRPAASASTRCSPTRARVAGCYREALGGHRGARAALRGPRRRRARLVRVRRAAARAASIATGPSARCASAGIQSKPYLPAIHLMSFYRERFGHREGEFPVCEDVAARSLALPFFPRDERGAGRARGAGAARGLGVGARSRAGRGVRP